MIKTLGEHRGQIPGEIGECQGKRELEIFLFQEENSWTNISILLAPPTI